jgi:hypothetical protein
MAGSRRSETIIDAEVVSEAPSTSFALVPLSARIDRGPATPLARPDPSFVTQLIATAEQAPQTRTLRRGSYADAQAAYEPHIFERRSVTRRTRQVI